MRVLGLDPGDKRIGVAVTDPLGITAQGIDVVEVTSIESALDQIVSICRQYSVERIVVGNPVNMNGTCGPASKQAKKLAVKLKHKTGLPVEMVDERLTSIAAERVLLSADVSRKKRRETKDKLAAVLILENYLSAR